jgi:death-on-curing protein
MAQLAEHGGVAGTRDAGLLDSALARLTLLAYAAPDAFALAASLRLRHFHNHPFIRQ